MSAELSRSIHSLNKSQDRGVLAAEKALDNSTVVGCLRDVPRQFRFGGRLGKK